MYGSMKLLCRINITLIKTKEKSEIDRTERKRQRERKRERGEDMKSTFNFYSLALVVPSEIKNIFLLHDIY
jgi:hypothetical protein